VLVQALHHLPQLRVLNLKCAAQLRGANAACGAGALLAPNPRACARTVPSVLLPYHAPSRCLRMNKLGNGATVLAQALHHLPQLQTLDLSCALATAQRVRRATLERDSHHRSCVRVRARMFICQPLSRSTWIVSRTDDSTLPRSSRAGTTRSAPTLARR
jgi:hypothetical protein